MDEHAQRFFGTDLDFAKAAGDSGAASAFRMHAAPDAKMFGRHGFLVLGPDEIARAVDGPARWEWAPVAGGGSAGGDIGWTVGEATITSDQGPPLRSKYLTIWREGADGSIRFILDAGSSRP
jgi:hypothetical protein